MGSSYYDLDAILTDAQKTPCTFELTVPGLGYLEGNAGAELKQGTKVDLPLWLGEMLAVSQTFSSAPLVTLDLPDSLAPRVLNALKADARSVELRSLAPHFYALATRMLELFDEDEMIDVLSESFKQRAASIADQAHNPRGAVSEGAEFMQGLDENERALFRAAHDAARNVRTWIAEIKKK